MRLINRVYAFAPLRGYRRPPSEIEILGDTHRVHTRVIAMCLGGSVSLAPKAFLLNLFRRAD